MSDQAQVLRGLMERRQVDAFVASEQPKTTRAHTIAVTSGKGGVGKSNIALNLSIALEQLDCSVCLLDANSGLGNIDLLCGLNGYWNFSHVVTGARTLKEIVLKGPGGIDVIPGVGGISEIADCPPIAQQDVYKQLDELEQDHDFIVIDTGSGTQPMVRQFVVAADQVLIVTTPEPTSIADAYATLKYLSTDQVGRLDVLVNRADSAEQSQAVIDRLQQTARLFLRMEVSSAGHIPEDFHVVGAVARRKPFLLDGPHSAASRSVQQLAGQLKNRSKMKPPRGSFFARIRERINRKSA